MRRLFQLKNLLKEVFKLFQNVYETDRRLVDLVRNMDAAFAFVADVQALPHKSESTHQAIAGLLKQTIECCLFVSRYAKRCFLKRMFEITSGQKIDEFEQALAHLPMLRQRPNPSPSDAFNRPTCLPETRVQMKEKILRWAFADNVQNIFWLHGVAGFGKSTVSTTIAQHFRDMSRLSAFLFFEREKRAIVSHQDNCLQAGTLRFVYQESILEGLDKDKIGMSTEGPIVIVLDALDECGTAEIRPALTQLFQKGFSKLPKNFRFLVTSQRESEIDRVLSSHPEITLLATELDCTSATSHRDVPSYLRIMMHTIVREQVEIPEDRSWDENITQLGKAAGGLFIRASTAVKMIRGSDNPFYHLKCLVSDSKSVSGFGLDKLFIDAVDANQIIVDRCLFVMENTLHFNMCNLETSSGRNADVPELVDRVMKCRPSHLEHVCIYWAWHLCDVPRSSDLLERVSDFASKRLLFWLEVLSLVKVFCRVANLSLLQVAMWIGLLGTDIVSFLEDAGDLATVPIMESTPHVCVTMIPLSKDESMTSEAYEGVGRARGGVRSVAVSPDGRVIASVAEDATIKVWHFHGGEEIMTLADNSLEVSFFPDGRRLASASSDGALRIWDVQTSEVILGPLRGQGDIYSVAISSGGTRIASGHLDGAIIVWDMTDGMELSRFVGHTDRVLYITFSPDGTLLASGSDDGSTRIWEMNSPRADLQNTC
ncbi:hypothetical protein A7U60_g3198 [Sanghuangporus baumii]|uniref:Nephrocystin 3-like N-terminal domain-containing protein n=1 Tax=Sanghuangporus baumii TaxID=108892 RepID=A0A9Q5I177_SANBA|nr:hypothetical protein A7U60_g3198 [Sanghuangporus baumii]